MSTYPAISIPVADVAMFKGSTYFLTGSPGLFAVQLNREPTKGERHFLVERITLFPSRGDINPARLFFTYGFNLAERIMFVQCIGVYNDPKQIMNTSKALRVAKSSPIRKKGDRDITQQKMFDTVNALLKFCSIRTNGEVTNKDGRKECAGLILLLPSKLVPNSRLPGRTTPVPSKWKRPKGGNGIKRLTPKTNRFKSIK